MSFISDLAGDDKRNMPHVDDSVRQGAIGFGSLPDYLATLQSAYGPQMQAELAAQAGVTGGYNQLGLDTLAQYGGRFAELGNQLNRQNAIGDINTDAATLRALQQSGGLDIARQLDIQADPLYNAARAGSYGQLDQFRGMLSPTLTGSEMEQISRGINSTGGIGVNSQSRNIANAGVFGQAGQQKLAQFGSGIQQAANIAQGMKLPTGTFTTSFGKSRNNPGLGAYQGVAPLSNTANQFGGQLLGQVNGYVNAMNEYKSGRKPTGDKVAQDVNTATSIAGAVGGV